MSGNQPDFWVQNGHVPAQAGTQVGCASLINKLGSRRRGNGVPVRIAPSLEM
jgi:hypothetical protein